MVQLVDPGTDHKSRKPRSLAVFRMTQGFVGCYYLPAGDPGTLLLNPLHVVDGSASELRLKSENLPHHLTVWKALRGAVFVWVWFWVFETLSPEPRQTSK